MKTRCCSEHQTQWWQVCHVKAPAPVALPHREGTLLSTEDPWDRLRWGIASGQLMIMPSMRSSWAWTILEALISEVLRTLCLPCLQGDRPSFLPEQTWWQLSQERETAWDHWQDSFSCHQKQTRRRKRQRAQCGQCWGPRLPLGHGYVWEAEPSHCRAKQHTILGPAPGGSHQRLGRDASPSTLSVLSR